ncbi:MAG: energy transducer TonB [Ignavibacteriaceae bacterium]|jgi:protein TonB|nr:energy transducer TonB [Ignavibacteriaceae bacterium]
MPSIKNPKADLRKLYYRTFEVSLILALAVIVAAFQFSPQVAKIESVKTDPQEIIKIEDIINTVHKPDIPPPPKTPQIITATVDDLSDDFVLPDIDDVEPVKLPDKPPTKPDIDLSDEIFIEIPEELPSPVGGLKSLQEKVHYTEIAKRIGLEGTVYIQAKIDKNGDVVEVIVLKGLGAGLDEEALNAVKLTKFVPGKQRGKAVKVKMVIPIKFVLK